MVVFEHLGSHHPKCHMLKLYKQLMLPHKAIGMTKKNKRFTALIACKRKWKPKNLK